MRVVILSASAGGELSRSTNTFEASLAGALSLLGIPHSTEHLALNGGFFTSSLRAHLFRRFETLPGTLVWAADPRTAIRGVHIVQLNNSLGLYRYRPKSTAYADRIIARLALRHAFLGTAQTEWGAARDADRYGKPFVNIKAGYEPIFHPGTGERVYDAVWVGQLGRHKRPDLFLSAFARAPNRRGAMVVSGNPEFPEIARSFEVQRRTVPNVEVQYGPVPLEKLLTLYRASRAVISTSYPESESIHFPPIEGYLCGCVPVVPRSEPYLSVFQRAAGVRFWDDPDQLSELIAQAEPVEPTPEFVEEYSMAGFAKNISFALQRAQELSGA
jgi:glycosyltransferase involved in cell wall biosynthesis